MLLLNYKPVLSQPTGIGVYANAVLPALQTFEHLLISGGGSGGVKERLKRLAWSQLQLPHLAQKLKADLIFTPAPEGYLGEQRVPQVVMVHDLRPLSHPDRSIQSVYFKYWVPKLLKSCKHILTNSNFTASEISRSIGVSEAKISVTPLGYDADHFYPLEVIKSLHHRPYLLHIGQAYPHKNLARLINAFNAISHRLPEVDLLLLGKPHPFETTRLKNMVSELGLSNRVVFKSYVPYSDLPTWYNGALALVYPSLWEGFGLPILEAMACGCPVITSRGSAMEEVAGDCANYVNPTDLFSIQSGIMNTISQESRLFLAKAGIERASQFSWSYTRSQTLLNVQNIIQSCTASY